MSTSNLLDLAAAALKRFNELSPEEQATEREAGRRNFAYYNWAMDRPEEAKVFTFEKFNALCDALESEQVADSDG